MRRANWGKLVLWVACALPVGACLAQARTDFGKTEYDTSCANCHGSTGKGDGVLARHLVKAPTDLTTLSKRNGGIFPAQRAWETIDGRTSTDIGAHGTREMPLWGHIYRSEDSQYQPDWVARNRMAALLDYLARIQEK